MRSTRSMYGVFQNRGWLEDSSGGSNKSFSSALDESLLEGIDSTEQ